MRSVRVRSLIAARCVVEYTPDRASRGSPRGRGPRAGGAQTRRSPFPRNSATLSAQEGYPAGCELVGLARGRAGADARHQSTLANVAVASSQLNPNAARPYPGFAGITTYETTGNSIYHSLQVSGSRRFSNGLAL